ncbi:polysaccharide deacetylase family protein [Marinobacter sp. VGCF2001]|uniref:polysaccharide deacetylase family protein n=1 Tax=Marinobacter sp. VGCF2001 TaxID=3417189 RepID=UPI003CF6E402
MGLFSKTIRTLGPWGGYQLARQICRTQPRILMYHRFSNPPVKDWASPKYFEQQVRHIKENYNSFSLVGLMQYKREHGHMPRHAVVITVDDGYRDFYHYAYPILRKYQVPATLFVTTGFIDRRLWLWPDKITWLLSQVDRIPEAIKIGSFRSGAGEVNFETRPLYWKQWIHHALSLPDVEKHFFIDQLASGLGKTFPDSIPPEFEPVNWLELSEMQDNGIEIGGHTVTHPSLGRVTKSQAREEIFGCRDALNARLGGRCRTFCYPNGQPSDFRDFLPGLVQEAGFLGAVTAFPDAFGTREPMLMRRHVSGDDMFQFFKSVSGVELIGLRLRKEVRMGLSGAVSGYAG